MNYNVSTLLYLVQLNLAESVAGRSGF